MFEGQIETSERINWLYDVTRHPVIGNLRATLALKLVCKTCGKGSRRDIMHTCDQTYSD
jgi:hypothetical protein